MIKLIMLLPQLWVLIIGHEIAMFLNLPFMFLERVDGEFELRRGFSFEKGSNMLNDRRCCYNGIIIK